MTNNGLLRTHSARSAAEQRASKREHLLSFNYTLLLLAGLALAAMVIASLIFGRGLGEIASSVGTTLALAEASPGPFFLGFLFLVGALQFGVHELRCPGPRTIRLPAPPPVPDLRFDNRVFLGAGWTEQGHGEGDEVEVTKELIEDPCLDEPHCIIPVDGVFRNAHVKGAPGAGKTEGVVKSVLDQVIAKYPRPPCPDTFPRDARGRIRPAHPATEATTPLSLFRGALARLRRAQAEPAPLEPLACAENWCPYDGMIPEDARAEHARLLDLHERLRPGVFLITPKEGTEDRPSLTDFVYRSAVAAGREDDLIVLEPFGGETHNPVDTDGSALLQAVEMIAAMEAVDRERRSAYWKGTMRDWLRNAIELHRAATLTACTFPALNHIARDPKYRLGLVQIAEGRNEDYVEAERLERVAGRTYTGPRIDPELFAFQRDWEMGEENDKRHQREVLSGLKDFLGLLSDPMLSFLTPVLPATIGTLDGLFARGKIVVFDMPQSRYPQVGRLVSILLASHAQRLALERLSKTGPERERPVFFMFDEFAEYQNTNTAEFLAKNRESGVSVWLSHQAETQLSPRLHEGSSGDYHSFLQTKLTFRMTDDKAAAEEVKIFGKRKVTHTRVSENVGFTGVEYSIINRLLARRENQSYGVTEELRDEPVVSAEQITSLADGYCVARPFCAEGNARPRIIRTPLFFEQRRAARLAAVPPRPKPLPPHPVVRASRKAGAAYVPVILAESYFAIVEPLATADLEVEGIKFVTDLGTLIVDVETLEEIRPELADALEERHPVLVSTDLEAATELLLDTLDLPVRVLTSYGEACRAACPGAPQEARALVQAEMGQPLPYKPGDAWAWHRSADDGALRSVSRGMLAAWGRLSATLGAGSAEAFDRWLETQRDRALLSLQRGGGQPQPGPAQPSAREERADDRTGGEDEEDDGDGSSRDAAAAPEDGPGPGGGRPPRRGHSGAGPVGTRSRKSVGGRDV